MSDSRIARLFLEDEATRIGSGWRVVSIREGDLYAYLTTPRATQRIRIEVLDLIEERTEELIERCSAPPTKQMAKR